MWCAPVLPEALGGPPLCVQRPIALPGALGLNGQQRGSAVF